MILTDLADAARTSGLEVVETPGWRQRGHGSLKGVSAIICHHTAGPATGNMPSLRVVTEGRADLAGPLCNLALGRDGTVYVVAAGVAWHAGAVTDTAYDNWHTIGIEAEATGRDPWPPVQYDAYARLCAALCAHYKVPVSRVLGHKEVCKPHGRKIDPNFNMTTFRDRVAAIEEDDMALSDEDVMKVAQAVGKRLAFIDDDKNPRNLQGMLIVIQQELEELTKAVQALADK